MMLGLYGRARPRGRPRCGVSPGSEVAAVLVSMCALCTSVAPSRAQSPAQSPTRPPATSAPSLLTVDRIYAQGEFRGDPLPSVHWLKDGKSFVELRPGGGGVNIVRVDAVTGQTTVLVPASVLSGIDVEDMTLSNDEGRALLFHDSQRVWRQNTKGQYTVVDFGTKHLTPVAPGTGPKLFAKFSPDGRLVAYVRDNDLYVFDLAGGTERRLTTDGGPDVINGTSDWVYEEELGVRDAFRWSPDGTRIAYWRFDQSAEPVMTLLDQVDSLYPKLFQYKYPKAGAPNAKVRIGIVRLSDAATGWIDTGPDSTAYIPSIGWASNDSVWLERLSRRQTRVELLMASATTGTARTVLTDADSAYVVASEPVWVNGGKHFLWVSDRNGWRQVYLYGRSGSLVRQLTRDGYDVLEVAGVDEEHGEVYVRAAAPTPTQIQVYHYALGNGRGGRLTPDAGAYEFSLAPGGRYAAVTHSTLNTPPVMAVYELPAMHAVRRIVDNASLNGTLRTLDIAPATFLQIPAADGTTLLDAYRIVPPGFDSTKKYPVLMYTYGGPASPQVRDTWVAARYLFHQLLAQRGYVVVVADNRGSAWRGTHFRKMTQHHLGVVESDDQIAVARWIGGQSWGDSARIGLWGWSYGGYNTAMSAFRGGAVFKVAISVAPVSDWRFYDTIYTERFMGLPAENPDGYRSSAVFDYVPGLTAKYLLVFGTGDDNVHPQNSEALVRQLQLARKPFSVMFFPNKTHAITGPGGTLPLYDLLQRFITENL